jgi:hypothetical protein
VATKREAGTSWTLGKTGIVDRQRSTAQIARIR